MREVLAADQGTLGPFSVVYRAGSPRSDPGKLKAKKGVSFFHLWHLDFQTGNFQTGKALQR